MNKQVDVAFSAPQFKLMSREEIIEYFAQYQFSDLLGHKLILCDDFLRLVDDYVSLHRKNAVSSNR